MQEYYYEFKILYRAIVISEPQFVIFNDMLSYETELAKRGNDF